MTEPVRTGPREWPINVASCASWQQINQAVRTLAQEVATELLWMLSGRRFGLYPLTVRPCRRACSDPRDWRYLEQLLPTYPYGSTWCRCRSSSCSCAPHLCEVDLTGPVHDVVEVRVDGLVVPAGAYQVHNHRWLVRVDGECWPDCQDLTAANDEPGAFVVTYRRGIPVPTGGQWAGGQLACEIEKAAVNDNTCRLPKGVQSVVRQGVQQRFVDPAKLARDGMTGLPEVDQWLGAVNPNRLPRDSVVWSPDLRGTRRVTS